MKLIADLCVEHDVIAVSDEIYEYIVFDDKKHISMASFDEMEGYGICQVCNRRETPYGVNKPLD